MKVYVDEDIKVLRAAFKEYWESRGFKFEDVAWERGGEDEIDRLFCLVTEPTEGE